MRTEKKVIIAFSQRSYLLQSIITLLRTELLALLVFVERLGLDLEGSTTEIITRNQVLKYFLSSPRLKGRDSSWLETLGTFGAFLFSMKFEKIHVLPDALSKVTDEEAVASDEKVHYVNFLQVIAVYEHDQVFGRFLQDLVANESVKLEK